MNRSTGKPVLLLCLLLLAGAFGGASAQNLLVNGDFEGDWGTVSGFNGCVANGWTPWERPVPPGPFVTDGHPNFWRSGNQEYPPGSGVRCGPTPSNDYQRIIGGSISSGSFNGGLVQAVATTQGTDYDLDAQLKLFADSTDKGRAYYGYDLTGQTADPEAATIVWSPIYRVPQTDTWSQYSVRFTATGSSVSVWIRASIPIDGWGLVDVDNIALAPAAGAARINSFDPAQPVLRNPGFEDSDIVLGPDSTTATISWFTDIPSTGRVDYGTGQPEPGDPGVTDIVYENSVTAAGTPGKEHVVTLTGLQADSTYHFRFVNTAAGAKTAYSRDCMFATSPVETGNANPTTRPWVAFEELDQNTGNRDPGLWGPAPQGLPPASEGLYFFGALDSSGTKSGGLYQRVSATPGARYSFKADFLTFPQPSTHPTDDMVFIAIDPLGGTDMYAPSVVWNGDGRGKHCFDPMQQDCGVGAFNSPVAPAWNNNIDSGLGNPTEVTAVAQSDTITVFVYFWQKFNLLWNRTAADNLRLVRTDPANVASIGEARQEYDSTVVNITNPQVVTLVPISDTGFFYAQDPDGNAGIRIEPAGGSLPALGENVSITSALLATNADGERVLKNATVTVTGGSAATKLRTTINRSIGGEGYVESGGSPAGFGLTNQGLLLKVFGRVTKVDYVNDYFLMDDGSAVDAQDTAAGIKVIRTGLLPIEGQYVSVTGVVSAEKINGKQIRVLRGRENFGEVEVLN